MSWAEVQRGPAFWRTVVALIVVDGTDAISWVNTHTDLGDLVILPFVGDALRPVAERIYDSGRSLLAAAQNLGSQSALGGSTMSLPIGGP